MVPSPETERGHDPCLQIQVDLSAMLDGELDGAGVRRVMVHSDACQACRRFLEGVRVNVGLHRSLAATDGVGARDGGSKRLRDELVASRRKLARVLYELGRGFVLMGLSPDFSREVAQEPVPVPDAAQRGRNLLDEVRRSGADASWVLADELLDGRLRSPEENLGKGQRLLTECLALEPAFHEARIYLGLLHHVRGQRSAARRQFQHVLAHASDPVMRGYALSNLGNIHLDEGDSEGAVGLLLQLVDSGILPEHPKMSTALFNLAIAYGMKGDFGASQAWFERLHVESPHKRTLVGRELARRSQFLHLLRTRPDAAALALSLRRLFPMVDGASIAAGSR